MSEPMQMVAIVLIVISTFGIVLTGLMVAYMVGYTQRGE